MMIDVEFNNLSFLKFLPSVYEGFQLSVLVFGGRVLQGGVEAVWEKRQPSRFPTFQVGNLEGREINRFADFSLHVVVVRRKPFGRNTNLPGWEPSRLGTWKVGKKRNIFNFVHFCFNKYCKKSLNSIKSTVCRNSWIDSLSKNRSQKLNKF